MNMIKEDMVNNPSHYKGGSFECIEIMEMMFSPEDMFKLCVQTAFQYVWRYEKKNQREDIEKADWYLKRANTYSDKKLIILYTYLRVHSKLTDKVERLLKEFPENKPDESAPCGGVYLSENGARINYN